MIFGGVCFLGVGLTYPETMAQVILKKKAVKLRKSTYDNRYHTFSELNSPPFKEQLSIAFNRPFKMLSQELIMIMTSLYIGVVGARKFLRDVCLLLAGLRCALSLVRNVSVRF